MRQAIMHNCRLPRRSLLWAGTILGATLLLFVACRQPEPPAVDYAPIAQLEKQYGRLITVSNSPTPDQNGTGDWLGLFRDDTGTVWGIPLLAGNDGSVLGTTQPQCAQSASRAGPSKTAPRTWCDHASRR